MTEEELQGKVEGHLTRFGWTFYHTRISIYSKKGFPDLVAYRGPRLLVAELKSMKGKVTDEQEAWLARFRQQSGCEVYLWRPCDLDAIVEVLQ